MIASIVAIMYLNAKNLKNNHIIQGYRQIGEYSTLFDKNKGGGGKVE
jgi:hypothetical protein